MKYKNIKENKLKVNNKEKKQKIEYLDESDILRKCKTDLFENVDFFLGSGASISSGIPSGRDIVWQLKRDLYCTNEKKDLTLYENLQSQDIRDEIQKYFDEKENFPKCGSDNEYSFYFENCYQEITQRDSFIKNLINGRQPSEGYKNLGKVLSSKFAKTVWTTNFDNLVFEGLRTIGQKDIREYSNDRPPEINKLRDEKFPTICKLHGDIKYDHTKNTSSELDSLENTMENCFRHILTKKALFVIGYSGIDNSIMSFFEKNLNDLDFLSKGLYWFNIKNGWISPRVIQLLDSLKLLNKPCGIVVIKNFDDFMCNLIKSLGLHIVNNTNNNFFSIEYNDKENIRKKIVPVENIYEKIFCSESNEMIRYGVLEFQKYYLDLLTTDSWENLPNIILNGIAGIGKTTELKLLYNKICDDFLPNILPIFMNLQNYTSKMFNFAFLEDKKYILFVDGFEEFSDSLYIEVIKDIKNTLLLYKNIRIIIVGRNTSFIGNFDNELRFKTFILKPYLDDKQQNIRNLIYKYENTPIKNLLTIPLFRYMAENDKVEINQTYLKQYNFLFDTMLSNDKLKFNYARNLSERVLYRNEINSFEIKNTLKKLSKEMFQKNKLCFSELTLSDCCKNSAEYEFLLKSSLFNYNDKYNIEFVTIYYFYFFLSFYLCELSAYQIEKLFFTKTGKIKEKYIDLLYELLKIVNSQTVLYKLIKKKMSLKSSVYVLLTDYTYFPNDNRFDFYKKIVYEYDKNKKLIYYGRFNQTHDILKNIDSLSDSMHKLLPEQFYDDAVQLHCNEIRNFIENPSVNNIMTFENAVILLGVHNRFWKENQQELLKEISISLIKFFRENKLAKYMEGLLSEDIVLSWYEDYGWTTNWNEKEWNSFVEKVNGKKLDFYTFDSEKDFRLKLKLFIHFHKNIYIRNLLVPLALKILSNKTISSDMKSSIIPRNLDDEFETATIHFDNDIFYFTSVIKEYVITISDVLLILNSCVEYYLNCNSDYQLNELYKEIVLQFKNSINKMKESDISDFYKLFTKYIEYNSGLYIGKFSEYLELLNDEQKVKIFTLLLLDLREKEKWQNEWILCKCIIILLDIENNKTAISSFQKLKDIGKIYNNCIYDIFNQKLSVHPLYEISKTEYPIIFAEQIKKDEKRNKALKDFEDEKQNMLKNEINVVSNKESLLSEINKILDYLNGNREGSKRDSDRGRLLELEYENIGNKIQYNYADNYSTPPMFSCFAIKYLFNSIEIAGSLNREKIYINIESWFSDEKYFWRYFFWLFICHYKKEEINSFLEQKLDLISKIKDSMKNDVSILLENDDIELYDGGNNRYWVVPFIHYLKRFYNNKLPEWVNKQKLLNFVAYPAWALSTGYGVYSNEEFNWQNWNSVFDWLEEVTEYDADYIIKKALDILSVLKSDQSKTQIITVFVEKVKTESVYKLQMLDAVIDKTIVEIQKNYKNFNETSIMNGGALSSFWRETKENLIDKIYDYLDFSKYDPNDVNQCRNMIFEYFCRKATLKQKNKTIDLLKNKIADNNVRIYLAKLGYERAILKTIDEFLNGKNFNTNYAMYSPLFGNSKKSMRLLKKYFQLYEYSIKKDNDRRRYLISYARTGILQTTSRRNFHCLKRKMNRLISKLKKENKYFESTQNFLNEIEQKVFEDDSFQQNIEENN